ncbi:unnamed protein product [Allacma fusca]|uniref:Uncharacterized protein n=1 Tax=Allacma fusca TaxID=39272 RepID=A0A8J2PHN3_9HEXA|nr:unnamed protein product [Allacma fusca]
MSAKSAKDKYMSSRGVYYSKCKKGLPSGSGRTKKSPEAIKHEAKFIRWMSFLDNFMQKRQTPGNYSDSDDSFESSKTSTVPKLLSQDVVALLSADEDAEEAANTLRSTQKLNGDGDATISYSRVVKRNRKNNNSHMEKLFEILEKKDDPDDIFAKSVAVSLKKFDETNRASEMMKIPQVLYEITLKVSAATPLVYQQLLKSIRGILIKSVPSCKICISKVI